MEHLRGEETEEMVCKGRWTIAEVGKHVKGCMMENGAYGWENWGKVYEGRWYIGMGKLVKMCMREDGA